MANRVNEEVFKSPEARRAFEEELLIGDVTDTLISMLESAGVSQRELALRLDLTEGRISQILSGAGNLTLRSLATVGWALGLRFELQPQAMEDRKATPALSDPAPPGWLGPLATPAELIFMSEVRHPDHRTKPARRFKQLVSDGTLHAA